MNELSDVPVIDIKPYLEGDPASKSFVANSIDCACREIGFFIITGHPVRAAVIEQLWAVSSDFFNLPLDVKMKYKKPNRGYSAVGSRAFSYSRGIKTPPDLREGFNMGPFNFLDDDYHRNGGDLFAANIWPLEVEKMETVWCEYFATMESLGMNMIRLCALALGLPESFFDDKFDRASKTFQANYYPRQTEKPMTGQLRGSAHTDYGSLTILLRDDSPGGLQVLTKKGEWLDVPYVPDSFVINIGDLTAQWTNDRWVSNPHRVVNPPWEVARNSDRMSFPFFLNANYDAIIEPIETCCGPDNPPKYPQTTAGEYVRRKVEASRNLKLTGG
jgi:isopenicillin N synthase-like dioxygenase